MKLKGKILDLHLDFFTHKPKLILELNRQDNLDGYEKLKDKELIDIELKEEVKIRGNQANRYFHSLLNELARYNRTNGHAISDEELKIEINLSYGTIAKDENGKILGCKVPKGTNIKQFYSYAKWYKEENDCDCYLFYKRTSELNTKEFTQLIRGLERECKDVGIEILEDKEFNIMMEQYEKNFIKGDKNGI